MSFKIETLEPKIHGGDYTHREYTHRETFTLILYISYFGEFADFSRQYNIN